MRLIIVMILILSSSAVLAKRDFYRMRCNGKLIFKGTTLSDVVKYCGTPLNEKNWGNQYATGNHYWFKSPGESGCYYTYFYDKKIVKSIYNGYQGCPQ